MLHYRATIMFGLWFSGTLNFAAEVGVRLVILRRQAANRGPSGPTWRAEVLHILLDGIKRFGYLFAAAFCLNLLYLYLVEVMQYGETFSYSLEKYFVSFVMDIWGACAQGYSFNDCVPLHFSYQLF
jgi:hypothetical protein